MVGGWSSNNHALDSTEMFSGGAWTLVGPLPAAVSGGRGFTFANTFYMAGTTNMMKNNARIIYHTLIGGLVTMTPLKLQDEVWKFDTDTQTMVDVKLSDPIYYHAVNIADFCPGECMQTYVSRLVLLCKQLIYDFSCFVCLIVNMFICR